MAPTNLSEMALLLPRVSEQQKWPSPLPRNNITKQLRNIQRFQRWQAILWPNLGDTYSYHQRPV
eukprot:scaffold70717_cov42-Cyclotella_meneghiniana.AAC.4